MTEPRKEIRDFSFGSEMLKVHQSFSTVNAKVTVSNEECLPIHLLSCRQGVLASKTSMHTFPTNTDAKPSSLALNVDPAAGTAAARLSQKMDLLALEDSRVLLALRYREQLNKRSDMGSLFDDLPSGGD
jgi:hypothetical protein